MIWFDWLVERPVAVPSCVMADDNAREVPWWEATRREHRWKGNSAVDDVAKLVRPKLVFNVKGQQ